jgi:pyruvate,orthophosphate dikinase
MTATSPVHVYRFGREITDGHAGMRELLGGKGAGLHEMTRLGLPVPPGFTITTAVCTYFYGHANTYPEGLRAEVEAAVAGLERQNEAGFGDPDRPLLVSVRSGARASMPGMMDTVLNLGLTEAAVEGLGRASGNPRFAWDSYRRFVQMYGDVVMGVRGASHEGDPFETLLEKARHQRGVKHDHELSADDLRGLATSFKAMILQRTAKPFPDDPWEQLWGSIGAVFGSWMNARAVTYRKLYNIPDEWGTAVNVQSMVFGNMGESSGTGVAFTRDPSTGEPKLYGEFLLNAQGEDVVAGIRTPLPIAELGKHLPPAADELQRVRQVLEKHFRDVQDLEFTIQNGRFFMLQTRSGKRTARAAVRIAIDLCKEGLIGKEEALLRVEASQLDQLLHPTLDPDHGRTPLAVGLPASPGAVTGKVVFFAEDAEAWASRGEKVILVRIETSPEDIGGMKAALGILTARGGMTSHAAVVARGMGKTCVAGCGELHIDYRTRELQVKGQVIKQGEVLTLDGAAGKVYLGDVPKVSAATTPEFGVLMGWADEVRRLRVRANADTPDDARTARGFGAEGIGLCRTEHMFFQADRIFAVREMILAGDVEGRQRALDKILPMQREDFVGIFREMKGLPVTIRLLDPPLHEFLPQQPEEIRALAKDMGVTPAQLTARTERLHEFNPMLGHRGCRLGISYPEIYRTQVVAIVQAACTVAREGVGVHPEIEIPLVGHERELGRMRQLVEETVGRVLAEERKAAPVPELPIKIGTMIELPRACVVADRIAAHADFFSFGTNDLTQTTYGLSRDDAGKFLPDYVDQRLYEHDPFAVLDPDGVGALMSLAISGGRRTRPHLEVGICGEHGGEPRSVELCHRLGLDYVSCSPFRVPLARLAAAQAVCRERQKSAAATTA